MTKIKTPYGRIGMCKLGRREAVALRRLLEAADDRAFSRSWWHPEDRAAADDRYERAIRNVAGLLTTTGENK